METNRYESAASAVMRMVRGASLMVALAGAGGAALAQTPGTGSGWNALFANLITIGKTGATAVTALAFLIGLVAIGYGGKLLWDKGGERGEDIKMGRIIFTIVGGTILVALGFIAATTVETMGGSATQIGTEVKVN